MLYQHFSRYHLLSKPVNNLCFRGAIVFFCTKRKTTRYKSVLFFTLQRGNWQLNAVSLFELLFSYSLCLILQVFLWYGSPVVWWDCKRGRLVYKGIFGGCGALFDRMVALSHEEWRSGYHIRRYQFRYSQTWATSPAFIYEKGPASSIQLSPCGPLTSFYLPDLFTWTWNPLAKVT